MRFCLDTAYRALSADPYKRRLHSSEYTNKKKNYCSNEDDIKYYVHENIKTNSNTHSKNNQKYDRKKNDTIQSVRCRGSSALTSKNTSRNRTTSREGSNLTRYTESLPNSKIGSRSGSPLIRTHRSGSSVGSGTGTGTESGSTVHSEYEENVRNKSSSYTDSGRILSTSNKFKYEEKEKEKEKDKDRFREKGEGRTAGGGGGVKGFIPGGCTEGKEFNAYAHGSRVHRATMQNNAAAAAR